MWQIMISDIFRPPNKHAVHSFPQPGHSNNIHAVVQRNKVIDMFMSRLGQVSLAKTRPRAVGNVLDNLKWIRRGRCELTPIRTFPTSVSACPWLLVHGWLSVHFTGRKIYFAAYAV